MRAARLAVAAALLLAIWAPPESESADADRQSLTLRFLTKKPGEATASRFHVEFRDPSDPRAKPASVQQQVTRLPRGTKLDTTSGERCTASDAELILLGRSACPSGSYLFPGEVVADNGRAGPLPRYTRFRTWMFDNGAEMVSLLEMVDPATEPPVRFVTRTQIRGRVMVTRYPGFVTDPFGESHYAALRSVTATPPPPGTLLRLTTPRSCPASGRWITRFKFTYRDGITQQARAATPCREERR